MATGITGDFTGLNRLIASFSELSSGSFKAKLASNLGQAARREIVKSFDQERSPYGERWQALKPATLKRRRNGGAGAKILQDTRRLRNSVTNPQAISANASGHVSVNTNVEYAAIHNFGGTVTKRGHSKYVSSQNGLIRHRDQQGRFSAGIKIPKRQFFPDEQRGLGPIWTDAFNKEASAFVNRLFAKGTR